MDCTGKGYHEKLGELWYSESPKTVHRWSGAIEGCAGGFDIVLNSPDLEVTAVDFIVIVIQNWKSYMVKSQEFIKSQLDSQPEIWGYGKRKECSDGDVLVDLPRFVFFEKYKWSIWYSECIFRMHYPNGAGANYGTSVDFDGEQPCRLSLFSKSSNNYLYFMHEVAFFDRDLMLEYFNIYTTLARQLFEVLAETYQQKRPCEYKNDLNYYGWLNRLHDSRWPDIQILSWKIKFMNKQWEWDPHGEHCLFQCLDDYDNTAVEANNENCNIVDFGHFTYFLKTYPPAKEALCEMKINFHTISNLLDSYVREGFLHRIHGGVIRT